MLNPDSPESQSTSETNESFGDLLVQYERSHAKAEDGSRQIQATVISISNDSILLDIGYKIEGVLPLTVFQAAGGKSGVKAGDKMAVTIKGRNPEGYYELAYGKIQRPTDWAALEKAFVDKETILGTVIEAVKGGLSIDVGVRAFMPASRTGARDAADMEKLVGQEIRCRITKLDVTDEDVVVDHRVIADEEAQAAQQRRLEQIKEGDTLHGAVRSITDYGAFVDLGGLDGLLHVGDISWGRIGKPSDVLSIGQELEARVLKVDYDKRRVSLGLKQLQPHPWDSVTDKYKPGGRVRGAVTRVVEFGAFVELEPGIEGLIHISEMSWAKKVKKPSDVVSPGDTVDVVVLAVSSGDRRISLGLKQALGDPWLDIPNKFAIGSIIEGPVTSLTKFGAFVQLAEGVEGMIHVSDINGEKRIDHPGDVFKVGQSVKAQILEIDTERRRLRLGIKQMAPSGLDEYIAEHQAGDSVTGRIVALSTGEASIELGEGVYGVSRFAESNTAKKIDRQDTVKADLASLSTMLQQRWKTGKREDKAGSQTLAVGQIRSFRISRIDSPAKIIELELEP